MSADEIIARQLAKAAFGWMGTARHLIGPSLCRSNIFRTGGLRASSASLFHFWLIRLMSFSRWICTFQAARAGLKRSPQCIGHENHFLDAFLKKLFFCTAWKWTSVSVPISPQVPIGYGLPKRETSIIPSHPCQAS